MNVDSFNSDRNSEEEGQQQQSGGVRSLSFSVLFLGFAFARHGKPDINEEVILNPCAIPRYLHSGVPVRTPFEFVMVLEESHLLFASLLHRTRLLTHERVIPDALTTGWDLVETKVAASGTL